MLQITVPPEIQNALVTALNRAGVRECGGVLMAEHVGHNHFAVRKVTVQKPGAMASFIRKLSGAVRAIKAFYATTNHDFARFNYLGEWHSHPLFTTQPSSKDHDTMRKLVNDPRVGANFLVLLIFRLRGGELEGSAHTYLPGGSVHPSVLNLERTP